MSFESSAPLFEDGDEVGSEAGEEIVGKLHRPEGLDEHGGVVGVDAGGEDAREGIEDEEADTFGAFDDGDEGILGREAEVGNKNGNRAKGGAKCAGMAAEAIIAAGAGVRVEGSVAVVIGLGDEEKMDEEAEAV